MFNNVGTSDRIIRLLLAAVLLYIGLFVYSSTALGIGLAIAGTVLALSGLAGSCLLYGLLGIDTRKQQSQ
ncbi:MAG: DUF2892 domain-containing protein [Cyanobacteriota bacterium]|nr:DUF2892 domain-containing protein [Cyanobacteriota bacterium]